MLWSNMQMELYITAKNKIIKGREKVNCSLKKEVHMMEIGIKIK